MPCSIRSAPRSWMASQMVCGPVVSPACGTLRATDTEAHQAGDIMIARDRGGHLGARDAEVRRNIEDPAQLHSMVTGSGDAGVLNRFQEGFSRQLITHG